MKKAVIMAGGFGTRLRPLTSNVPKPMAPVANAPMMEHIINLLKRHGISEAISLLYFQPERITSYFGDGKDYGIKMEYVDAAADYGTAGSVKNAHEKLKERFIVISGDVLTDFDLSAAVRFHEEKGAKATMILTKAQNPLQFGIVMTSADGRINRFLEKPSWGEVFSDTINTGIYILEPDVLDLIPFQKEFDFSQDLFPLMLSKGMPLFGYVASGYWQDIGNLNQYQEANKDILYGKVHVDLKGKRIGESFISPTAEIHETAVLRGKAIIGDNAKIGPYAVVSNSVVGSNVVIGAGARLHNTVVWDGTTIGESADLTDDVICYNVSIGNHTTVAENVFIADECQIGDHAQLLSNIKLWPSKVVESRAILSRSLVQEEKWLRELFTDSRVTGIANTEMNPEFGAKFGAALGNALGAGKTIVASRDSNAVSRMIKRSITAGLISVGIDVVDYQVRPLPLTRQELTNGNEEAGFHVRQSPYYPDEIDIILLNGDGRDLPSAKLKKVERLFFGEDIKRVEASKVGNIVFPERSNEIYTKRFIGALKSEEISNRRFNIIVDYSYGMTATIFPRILGHLHCNAVGLNGYLDTHRSSRSDEEMLQAHEQISSLVTSLKYHAAFIVDSSSEKVSLIDEKGVALSSSDMIPFIVKIFLDTHKHREPYTIAVPISASSVVETIAKPYNVTIKRIKNSHSAAMDATLDKEVLLVAGTRGRFIFTDFYFSSDGMFSVAKILEMLATSGKEISEVVADIPKRYLHSSDVPCPWEKKGSVMRQSMEYSEGKERQLVDGVKVKFDNGDTVLFLPDREDALFHVIAESDSKEHAEQLCKSHVSMVEGWREA